MIAVDSLTNSEFETVNIPSSGGGGPVLWKQPSTRVNRIMRPKDFIGLEMSLVPQVEKVFVEDTGKDFRVLTVVNERNAVVRSQIYKREQVIMEELKHADFDFQIIARENRCLAEIMNPAGELAYKR